MCVMAIPLTCCNPCSELRVIGSPIGRMSLMEDEPHEKQCKCSSDPTRVGFGIQ